jgi:hypothetical protein
MIHVIGYICYLLTVLKEMRVGVVSIGYKGLALVVLQLGDLG